LQTGFWARNDPGLNTLDFQGLATDFPIRLWTLNFGKGFATAIRRDTIEFQAGPRDFVRLPVRVILRGISPMIWAEIALAERSKHCRPLYDSDRHGLQ
jgi:hypothetical protein